MSADKKTVADLLVRFHLEAALVHLEREAAEGRYATTCLRALAGVATLLGHQQIAERALSLLRIAPDEAFYSGVLTNIDLPKVVGKLRKVLPLADLERRYRPFNEEEILASMRVGANTENHLSLCFDRQFREARSTAQSGLRLEEVGDTLAVLGEFEAALSVARDPALEPFRQRGILLILAIELFRRRRIEQSQDILADLESRGLDAWGRIHLALAFAEREPWGGYPYPDW